MNRPGIDVIGPLPTAIQSVTTFSGGIATACRQPESARALLAYLASPAAATVKQHFGMHSA